MTTFTDFNPSTITNPPFQFQATLDGVPYNVSTRWNIWGQRWYVVVTALDGTVVLNTAMVSSPASLPLAALSWEDGEVEAETVNPHGFTIGAVVALTIAGSTPDAYNGLFDCLVTGPSTLSYDFSADPGTAVVFGTAAQNINLIGGVPDETGTPFSSSLVFREPSNQFEVSP